MGEETESTVDHAEKIGAALSRLDVLEAANQTAQTAITAAKESADFATSRVSSLETSQYEVADRLSKLETEKAIQKEEEVIEKPVESAAKTTEAVAENTVEAVAAPLEVSPENKKREGPLSWFHRIVG